MAELADAAVSKAVSRKGNSRFESERAYHRFVAYTVFFFENGNTAVCRDGEQVPELQGSWLLKYMAFLESKGVDPLDCDILLPGGFKAAMFRTTAGGWNWRIVHQ